jgi:DNA-directed RNA polymerase subunit N (RpoN/RPB10)
MTYFIRWTITDERVRARCGECQELIGEHYGTYRDSLNELRDKVAQHVCK